MLFSLYHFFSLSQFPSSHFFLNICFFTAVQSCSAFLSTCLPLISLAVVCSVSEPITPAAPPLWSAQTLMKQPCESATVGSEEFTCTTHTHTHTHTHSNLERKSSSFILIVWLRCTLHLNYDWDSKFFYKTASIFVKNSGIESFEWSSVLMTFI